MAHVAADSGHRNQPGFTDGRRTGPTVVRVVAGLLALLAVLHIARVVVMVAINLRDSSWDPRARLVFLVLNAIVLVVSALYLVLAHHLRRGRMWAWVTAIVLLSLTVLAGALALLADLASTDVPWVGLVLLVPSLALLLALTVPGSARAFFTRGRPVAP